METKPLALLLLLLGVILDFASLEVEGKNKLVPVGCFRDSVDSPRALPEFAADFRSQIDWDTDDASDIIDACADIVVKKGYLYFGIQFYGECWSGPRAHLTYYRYGASENCENGVGKGSTNFVYRLSGEEDECLHFNILDSFSRSRFHDTTQAPSCDTFSVNDFKKGWYRFQDAAGSSMANSCVSVNHCGTQQSGWLYAALPEVTDNIQEGLVCFTDANSCCSSSLDIRLRNCGHFFVYYLPDSTNGCFKAYCGNGQ